MRYFNDSLWRQIMLAHITLRPEPQRWARPMPVVK